MEHIPCDPLYECRVGQFARGCFEDVHHKFWPKREYTTSLEKEFRELDINKVLGCRALHNELHAVEPPPNKPSRETMRNMVNQVRIITMLDEGGVA